MFDLGFSELLIIAVVALVVLGPERLPKAARFVGVWARRARAQWTSVKDELEHDLASEDLKRHLREARDAFRDTEHSIRGHTDEARAEFERMRATVASDIEAPIGDQAARIAGEHAPLEDTGETSRWDTGNDADHHHTYQESDYVRAPEEPDAPDRDPGMHNPDNTDTPAPPSAGPDSDDEPRRH
jgi:sec-independent protein translocase protein TatB